MCKTCNPNGSRECKQGHYIGKKAMVEDSNVNEEEEDGQCSEGETTTASTAQSPEVHYALVYLQGRKSGKGWRLIQNWPRDGD